MKKIICLSLVITLIAFSFCSCASKEKQENLTTVTQQEYIQQSYDIITESEQTTAELQTQTQAPATTQAQTVPATEQQEPQTQIQASAYVQDSIEKGSFSASDAAVKINGATVKTGTEYSDFAQSLGTASSVTQAPSCHYSGMDNIYTFSGFTVYTYFSGSSEIIYDVEVTSSAFATSKGIKVGDSAAAIKECYGNPKSENDSCIEYSSGSAHLSFYMVGGVVDTIEISSD